MKRVQVQFTDALAQELTDRAEAIGQPVAALVRQAVVRMLDDDERRIRRDRALAAIGGFHSGLGDVSENHDEYLVQAIEERLGRR